MESNLQNRELDFVSIFHQFCYYGIDTWEQEKPEKKAAHRLHPCPDPLGYCRNVFINSTSCLCKTNM